MELCRESFRIIYQVCLIDRGKRNVLVYASLVFYRASSSRFNPSSYRYFTSHFVLLVRFETVHGFLELIGIKSSLEDSFD